ncbi:MAG: hypothetical protein ACREJC_22540, partial [Tepidisphaeraceae bacterium]
GSDLHPGTADDVGGGSEDVHYVQGVHAKHQGNSYMATPALIFGTNSTPIPSGTMSSPWLDQTNAPQPVPLFLDAWGNPIIFVPATGLRTRLLVDKKDYDPGNFDQNVIILSPEGEMGRSTGSTPGVPPGFPYVKRPGRPFFASAGPDGDFTKGDDNLYSFEK